MNRLLLLLFVSTFIQLTAFCYTDVIFGTDSYLYETSPKAIPTPPKNLMVLETDFDYIYLIWENASEDATAFIIERHSEEDDYANYDTVSANTTYYLDYRVEPYTYYYYRVKAINQDGESAPSNEAIGQTRSLPHSPPRKPSNLKAIFNGSNGVIITWDDKSDNENAFYLYRGDTPATIDFLDSVVANTTEYVDYSIESGQTYLYSVTSSNSFGSSEPTDTIEIKIEIVNELESPILSILKTSSNSIHLVWDSISGNSIQYQLFRISDNDDTVKFNQIHTFDFNDADLIPNTTYNYQIFVSDTSDNHALSNIVEAKTLPGFVANRVSDSLIAMFILSQRDKELVPDYSWYGDPVELNIYDTLTLAETSKEALKLSLPNALISLPQHNNKISEACKITNEISIECWLKTSELVSSELTTVLTFGNDTSTVFSLNCQPSSQDLNKIDYAVNLSTRSTDHRGFPTFLSKKALQSNVLNHIVFSHDKAGVERFYINGQLTAEGYRPSGFENWLETYTLVLANDLDQQKPWLGELYMCSIYNTALEIEDISSNYTASPFTQDNFILNSVEYQMKISPNPASNYFSLAITNANENSEITEKYFIRIVNQYGQISNEIIVSDHLTGEPFDIDINQLPSGMYSVNLYNQHVLINTQKLLIIH
jgi:hypothetical protein